MTIAKKIVTAEYVIDVSNDEDNPFNVDLKGWRPVGLKDDIPDPADFKVSVEDANVLVEVQLLEPYYAKDEPSFNPLDGYPMSVSYDSSLNLIMCPLGARTTYIQNVLTGWWPTGAIVATVNVEDVDYEICAIYSED